MRFLFRADASVAIGSGHVMRCATLASWLAAAGHSVRFLCRDESGNLNAWLEQQGWPVTSLVALSEPAGAEEADISASQRAIGSLHYDWIVADHYQLGTRWEKAMAVRADRIMSIDDLGREHDCHLLLDQNYANSIHSHYRTLGETGCEVLLGPEFALVRPEFAKLRPDSLARRRDSLSRILIFMGGADPLNETAKAINGIALTDRRDVHVDVVIGGSNPHRSAVEIACSFLPNAELYVQTPRMAELMAVADCTIGAGGSSTWERCTLGLPALVTILADNQAPIAEAVGAAGAHHVLGWHHTLTPESYADALQALDDEYIERMSIAAAAICDGNGTARVATHLLAPDIRSGERHG